jgi:hypothetical protein
MKLKKRYILIFILLSILIYYSIEVIYARSHTNDKDLLDITYDK